MSFSEVLRAALVSCAALLTLSISTLAQAMTPEQAHNLLGTIHRMRVESYLAINAYYNFSNSNGDKSIAAEASSTVNRIEGLLGQIQAAPEAAEVATELAPIGDKWKRYRDLLNTNLSDMIKLGYPDLRLATDMAQANVDFVTLLAQVGENIAKTTNYQPNEMLNLVRASTIKIEQMMTAYAARSASNVAQVAQGAETDAPLDVLAAQFSDQLSKMDSLASTKDEATQKLVDSVITKWGFIKNSYINYNDNNVSYVANLYSRRIVESLQDLEGTYSKL